MQPTDLPRRRSRRRVAAPTQPRLNFWFGRETALAHFLLESEKLMLFTTQIGTRTPRVVFLHGLFGQGKNWTAIARGLLPDVSSLLIDLPNHGRSPWTEDFSYRSMADAVVKEISTLGTPPVLVGHSMGGKTAMTLALTHPRSVAALVIVDIAPDDSSHGYGFGRLVNTLRTAPVGEFSDRLEADRALSTQLPDAALRAFFLQNLHRTPAGFAWQLNLDLIAKSLPGISGWPSGLEGPSDVPVLWVRGGESGYVRDEHVRPMTRLFPRTHLVTIPGAGHWVNSDAPEELISTIREFLTDLRVILRGGPVGPG